MRLRDIRAYGHLYKDLLGRYKHKVVFLFSLTFVNGLLGSLGIASLAPLFSLVVKDAGASKSVLAGYVSTILYQLNIELGVTSLLIFVASLFTIKALTLYIFAYVSAAINLSIANDVKERIYRDALASHWAYLSTQKISYLDHSLSSDVGRVIELLEVLYKSQLYLASFIFYFFTAFFLSPNVTIAAIIIGALMIFFSKIVIRRVRWYARINADIRRDISNNINESVLGLKTIKALGAEETFAGSLRRLFDQYKKMSLKGIKIGSLLSSPLEPISYVFFSVVFAFSYLRPEFNLADFLVSMYLLKEIFVYTERFQSLLYQLASNLPFLDRLIELRRLLAENQEADGGLLEFQFHNKLEFKNVGFSYKQGDAVLKDINMEIKKNEIVGIVGLSGTGKTTIFDLLLRLFNPTSGEILIDGKNISKIRLAQWRKKIGYVSQDIYLCSDSIENNIKFYDKNITRNDLNSAVALAKVDFLDNLSGGLASSVGERGIELSVGQRQRIALARILARRPQILLLDEVTSSLDAYSEAAIVDAVKQLKNAGVTVIIVAHRLSTVLDADKIFYLDGGHVAEEGRPGELLKNQNSYFYKMYNAVT